MSKKRNRSIQTLPADHLSLFKPPSPECSKNFNSEELYFGEEVDKRNSLVFKKSHYIFNNEDSLETILIGMKDLGNSKSSSSSFSWGGEYKSETSKHIRDELKRMKRILSGLESIPSNYDEEEYKEWMKFFPNLWITGSAYNKYQDENVDLVHEQYKLLAVHPKNNFNKVGTVFNEEQIKTVADEMYGKVYQQVNEPPKVVFNDNIDVDKYLKVSSIKGSIRESSVHRHSSSSRCLISSQISSSKWLKDESEYNSLPFLVGGFGMKALVARPDCSGPPKGILKNNLVLPPIEMKNFRSSSATPRREYKSLSALSINGRIKNKLETSKLFMVGHFDFKGKTVKNKTNNDSCEYSVN